MNGEGKDMLLLCYKIMVDTQYYGTGHAFIQTSLTTLGIEDAVRELEQHAIADTGVEGKLSVVLTSVTKLED